MGRGYRMRKMGNLIYLEAGLGMQIVNHTVMYPLLSMICSPVILGAFFFYLRVYTSSGMQASHVKYSWKIGYRFFLSNLLGGRSCKRLGEKPLIKMIAAPSSLIFSLQAVELMQAGRDLLEMDDAHKFLHFFLFMV